MANKEDLKKSFTEVRKAYRLLYEYQKKILDLISFIQTYYGLNYYGWWQKFSDKLHKDGKKISLDNWAWDWLPMYFSNFQFIDNNFKLSILLVSDDGFFKNNENIEYGNYKRKLNISKFENAENAETKLIFILDKEKRTLFEKEHHWHSEELFDKINKEGIDGDTIYKAFNLEEFSNQASTEKILDELSEFAKKNGFELEKVDL